MLEVRYNTETKKLTGWCGDFKQLSFLIKRWGIEEIVFLDIPIPPKDIDAYLYDEVTGTLIDNPDYVGPPPTEMEKLKTRIAELEAAKVSG